MKTFIFLFALIMLSCASNNSGNSNAKVYVCHSKASIAYHKYENCRGLQVCSHKIVLETIDEAEMMGKKRCKICY